MAHIAKSGWSIAPPAGWTYTQGGTTTLATSRRAVLGVRTFDVAAPTELEAKRFETFERLASDMELTFPKKKLVWPKKAAKIIEVGALKVSLYQFDGLTRVMKSGPVLVFETKIGDGTELLGAGYVPADDDENADAAIMKALSSLKHDTEPPPAAAPATSAPPSAAPSAAPSSAPAPAPDGKKYQTAPKAKAKP
jgi:hypothetical protein